MGIMDKLSEKLLKTKVAGEKAMIAKTASFSLALEKRDLGSLAKEGINTGGDGPAFMLPDNIFSEIVMNGTALSDTETEISCQVWFFFVTGKVVSKIAGCLINHQRRQDRFCHTLKKLCTLG